jgi:prepilin-type N-terminal cleavage/methylation domain-containing protein
MNLKTMGNIQQREELMNNQRGYTLTEVLASITLAAIVLTAAAALYVSVQKMYASSSSRHQVESEMNRLAGLLSDKLSGAVQAAAGPNRLQLLTAEGESVQFTLTPLPDRAGFKLEYSRSGAAPIAISHHIAKAEVNGMDLNNLNETRVYANGDLLSYKFTFSLGSSTEILENRLKLIQLSLTDQPEE